jgi:hypothetical protein
MHYVSSGYTLHLGLTYSVKILIKAIQINVCTTESQFLGHPVQSLVTILTTISQLEAVHKTAVLNLLLLMTKLWIHLIFNFGT